MTAAAGASRAERPPDALANAADRALRVLGDARLAAVGLLVVAAINLVAALVPSGRSWLDGPAYAVALGFVALSAVAAAGRRVPLTWREWRRPGRVAPGSSALAASVADEGHDADGVAALLQAAGYRVRIERRRGRWAVHGTRRGWSPFAGQAAHLALVGLVLGAAVGHSFGAETTFSLLPGSQALLDAPRPGFSSALRLEGLDAAFAPDGRPQRLDVRVTFLEGGEPVRTEVLRVNEPGDFAGYAVHPWTYGPAARLRVTTLAGSPLVDDAIPLDETVDGRPAGALELGTGSTTLGLSLADGDSGALAVSVLEAGRSLDAAVLRPGEERRIGEVAVRLERFEAWVTFLSRRDPGAALLVGSAVVLCLSLAVVMWLPRRRVTIAPARDHLRITIRGDRFDRPAEELERIVRRMGGPR